MMKWFGLLLLLVLLSPSQAAPQIPDDKLIVDGERIGKWTLDMTIDDLLRMNGPRRAVTAGGTIVRQTDPGSQAYVHRWDHLGLRAWTIGADSQKVVVLAAVFEEFKTAKAVSLLSTKEAIEAAYGRPTIVLQAEPWTAVYDDIGLSWHPTSIRVFRPGSARQIWRF